MQLPVQLYQVCVRSVPNKIDSYSSLLPTRERKPPKGTCHGSQRRQSCKLDTGSGSEVEGKEGEKGKRRIFRAGNERHRRRKEKRAMSRPATRYRMS